MHRRQCGVEVLPPEIFFPIQVIYLQFWLMDNQVFVFCPQNQIYRRIYHLFRAGWQPQDFVGSKYNSNQGDLQTSCSLFHSNLFKKREQLSNKHICILVSFTVHSDQCFQEHPDKFWAKIFFNSTFAHFYSQTTGPRYQSILSYI